MASSGVSKVLRCTIDELNSTYCVRTHQLPHLTPLCTLCMSLTSPHPTLTALSLSPSCGISLSISYLYTVQARCLDIDLAIEKLTNRVDNGSTVSHCISSPLFAQPNIYPHILGSDGSAWHFVGTGHLTPSKPLCKHKPKPKTQTH